MPQPQDVIDAWSSMKAWVETELPGQALKAAIPNWSVNLGDLGLCDNLNDKWHSSTESWCANGDASLSLTGQKVNSFDGVTIQPGTVLQPASPTTGATLALPVNFSKLAILSSYKISQPCAEYANGKKGSTSTYDVSGTCTQTVTNGSFFFDVTIGAELQLNGAYVSDKPTLDFRPNLTFVLMSQDKWSTGFQDAIRLGSFGEAMLALLNSKLKPNG